jgi:hypothetical protein
MKQYIERSSAAVRIKAGDRQRISLSPEMKADKVYNKITKYIPVT